MITRLLGRAAGVFHAIERQGPPLPEGPVLVVANHPNSLLDPLVIFRVAGRPTRPLAKAPLFSQPGIGLMLRALNGLPVYRRQDDPGAMGGNDDTFRAAIAALRAGEAVQIYPEGISHSEPALQPLKTGAARIALGAESAAGWSLGLKIVPVGLTYARKTLFGGRVVARVGDPIEAARYRSAHAADEQAAVRELTEEITRRLEAVTLNLAEREDRSLIETAERIYAAEKGLSGWRSRPGLADRMPRYDAFAQGLGWLRAHDPERHARLARAVRRHHRRLAVLGAGDAEVPPEYTLRDISRYVFREGLILLLTLLPGLLGALLWAPPYQLTRLAVRRINPPREDTVATYKLGAALVGYPVFYGLWVAAAGWWGGPVWGAGAAVALPLLGALAIYWKSRLERVSSDARLFTRVAFRPGTLSRLAAERQALVAEFDDVWSRMPRQPTPPEAGS